MSLLSDLIFPLVGRMALICLVLEARYPKALSCPRRLFSTLNLASSSDSVIEALFCFVPGRHRPLEIPAHLSSTEVRSPAVQADYSAQLLSIPEADPTRRNESVRPLVPRNLSSQNGPQRSDLPTTRPTKSIINQAEPLPTALCPLLDQLKKALGARHCAARVVIYDEAMPQAILSVHADHSAGNPFTFVHLAGAVDADGHFIADLDVRGGVVCYSVGVVGQLAEFVIVAIGELVEFAHFLE
jgi:hypothetical protein